MEVASGKHVLIGWNEDHIRVEVWADGVVLIKISSCRTRYDENAVTIVIVFRHTQLIFSGNGIC